MEDTVPEIYSQYIFFNDNKLIGNLDIKNEGITFDIESIYDNIDLMETLSNITGLPILSIDDDFFYLGDELKNIKFKINPSQMSKDEKNDLIQLLKPYLWWGE